MTVAKTHPVDATPQWLDVRVLSANIGLVYSVDSSFVCAIEGTIRDTARERGLHFEVTSSPRWNAKGEAIGPEVLIDLPSAEVLIRVVARVADAFRDELAASYADQVTR